MDFIASQRDMSNAYIGGAAGVFVSGLAWGISGVIATVVSDTAGIAALFIGGMFIFPLSIGLSKLYKRSGKHAQNNALKHLAFENLAILFVGLFLAFTLAKIDIRFFYPVMLFAIGTRYLSFQTLYGLKTYWLLGILLILSGGFLLLYRLPFVTGAFIGSAIEIVFSFILFKQSNNADVSAAA